MSNYSEETEKLFLINGSFGPHSTGIKVAEIDDNTFDEPQDLSHVIRNSIAFFEGRELDIPEIFNEIDLEEERKEAERAAKSASRRLKENDRMLKEATDWLSSLKKD